MSFLLKNAKLFLEEAERDFQYGNWNFVLFHSEQALQLCLKYKIYSYAGDYPKTHDIGKLIRELEKYEEVKKSSDFNLMIDLLVEAYITTRYSPYEFSKDSAEKALSFVKDLMGRLGCL